MNLSSSTASEYNTDNFDVPAGKRLVMEHVYFEIVQVSTTAKMAAWVRLVSPELSNPSSVLLPLQLKYSTDHHGRTVYSEDLPLYASLKNPFGNTSPAWVDMYIGARTGQTSSLRLRTAVVTGYMEDVP